MDNSSLKKILGYAELGVTALIGLFGFFCILGVLIPTKVWGISVGNYFKIGKLSTSVKTGGAGRAIIVILFVAAIILLVTKFKNYNEKAFGAAAVVAALIVVVAAGCAGMGALAKYYGGGIKMIRWARIWLFIMTIANAAIINVKKFVIKED